MSHTRTRQITVAWRRRYGAKQDGEVIVLVDETQGEPDLMMPLPWKKA